MALIGTNMAPKMSPKLQMRREQLRELILTEEKINKNLFLVASSVTAVAMAMVVLAFFTRGFFPSGKMNMFYLGVVIIYSFHKELIRWLGDEKVGRQGEYFVYAWIGLTTIFYILDFLTKGYFSVSSAGEPLETIRESAALTIEVFIIFIITRGLKLLKVVVNRS